MRWRGIPYFLDVVENTSQERIKDGAVLATSTVSAAVVLFYIWHERSGLAFVLFIAPAFAAGFLLLLRYRSEATKDPAAPIAVLLTACVAVCAASLPQLAGLYDFSSMKGYVFGILCLLELNGIFWPLMCRIYRRLHRILGFHAYKIARL